MRTQNTTVRGGTRVSRHPYYAEVHFYATFPTFTLQESGKRAEKTARGG